MTNIIPTLIGGVSAFIIAKDGTIAIRDEQAKETQNDIGELGADIYLKHQSANTESHTINKMQKKLEYMYLDEVNYTRFTKVKNFFKATGKTFVDYLPQMALTTGAIAAGLSRDKWINRLVAWPCATILAYQGLDSVASNVLGVGKKALCNKAKQINI